MEIFGDSEDDDVDCLFYIYARYLTDSEEGIEPSPTSNIYCIIFHECRSVVHHIN